MGKLNIIIQVGEKHKKKRMNFEERYIMESMA